MWKIILFVVACLILPGGFFVLGLAIYHWLKQGKLTVAK
jgi:hypothetical protein